MNVTPCGSQLRQFAKQLVCASSVPHETDTQVREEALFSGAHFEEEPEAPEPGSRTVTEKEVNQSTGADREGWIKAAWKEYQESFLDMQAVSIATPAEVAAIGGAGRALPMKLVWVQKPEKKKCRGVVCGNFEE